MRKNEVSEMFNQWKNYVQNERAVHGVQKRFAKLSAGTKNLILGNFECQESKEQKQLLRACLTGWKLGIAEDSNEGLRRRLAIAM